MPMRFLAMVTVSALCPLTTSPFKADSRMYSANLRLAFLALSLGFPAVEPMPVDFVRAVAKSVVEVDDLYDPLTRERHDRFCGKCNNHSSSTHALHRL